MSKRAEALLRNETRSECSTYLRNHVIVLFIISLAKLHPLKKKKKEKNELLAAQQSTFSFHKFSIRRI